MAKAKSFANIDCREGATRAIQQVLLARLKKMCALRERALDWADPEGVHEMRVASRRLRSALSDFKPYLRKDSLPSRRFKAIAKSLGAVRDDDVALAVLEQLRSQAGDKVALGIEAIVEEHRRQRRQARSVLETAIRSAAIAELRDDFRARLSAATRSPHSSGKKGGSQVLTFGEVGTKVISTRLAQLCAARTAFYHPLQTRQLHKLRILAKKLRYAVELFVPCGGHEFKKAAKEIARLQTSLGDLHDCDVWIANLGARIKKGEKPDSGIDHGNYGASVWLLQRFVSERTKHYSDSLSRWHKWETKGFLNHLRAILDAGFDQNVEHAKSIKNRPETGNSLPLDTPSSAVSSPSREKN